MPSPSKPEYPNQKFSGRDLPAGKRFFAYWLPVLGLCALIFWQSCFPSIATIPLFPHDDKVMHLGAYAVLALLFARALKQEKPLLPQRKLRLFAILFASFYGLSDEVHQAFVPLRHASMGDLAADFLGSFAGACFYLDFLHRKK